MQNIGAILVVDDEVDITDIYKMLLEYAGYAVVVANNAVDALVLIAGNPPRLIVSDCMMPFMDGVEFSRRVRAMPGLETIPIILMSGAPELHDFENACYNRFLRKPLSFENLLAEIESLLLTA